MIGAIIFIAIPAIIGVIATCAEQAHLDDIESRY